MEKKVIILLSTYNGERYIKEQLDSLINQTYKNISILIRDDGSKDSTKKTLKIYEEKYKNINVIYGDNVGFYKSFLWLLKNAPKADYYAFCDQDDFWYDFKIEAAVKKMDQYKQDIPNLYFTDYDICDSKMKFIKKSLPYGAPDSLERGILAVQIPLGFNTVINYKIKEYIENDFNNDFKIWGHDYWCYLLALSFGNIIYDNISSAKYRRHDNNVSTFNNNFIKKQMYRIKNFLLNNQHKIIQDTVIQFYNIYNENMSEEKRKIFELFMKDKISIKRNIKKAFYKKRYSDSILDEFFIRMMLFISKL